MSRGLSRETPMSEPAMPPDMLVPDQLINEPRLEPRITKKTKPVPAPIEFTPDYNPDEKTWFAQGEESPKAERPDPEIVLEASIPEYEQREPAADEGAALEAINQEALRAEQREIERSAAIEHARTWAQKEAESAKKVAKGTVQAVKTTYRRGKVGGKVAGKVAGVGLVAGGGILASLARVPKFILGKFFEYSMKGLKFAQDKFTRPITETFKKIFPKDAKDKPKAKKE
ncbi:hypothetical protein KJ611_00955 [Patescibacteria group bacterium]|nr:hypothetical protein [Patescibacteria group bacterium]MBU1705896.1 hypothetical protein [Patescibacteria group bacterium]